MSASPDGVRLAYDDVGSGEAIVFVHAFPLDRTMWRSQLAFFGDRCRCVAVDLRGSGESPVVPPFTMTQLADDVAALLDHLRIERATIVGTSLGGYVAFALWRRHRERVRGLVLTDTRATADDDAMQERRQQLIALAQQSGTTAVADVQVRSALGKSTRIRHPELVEEVRGTMERASVAGIVGTLEAMLGRPDSTPLLPTIDVPTLVVGGEEDAITGPKVMRALAAAIPGAVLELIPGSGHLPSIERPAAFNAALASWGIGVRDLS